MKTNVEAIGAETRTIRRGMEADGALSEAARTRLTEAGGAALLQDWARILFIHYEADPALLQPQIPYELDLHNRRAFVSLTLFHGHGLRPTWTGNLGRTPLNPALFPHILNVRTYVRHHHEPGIHFLAEWIPNPIAAHIGRALYGLPFHTGHLTLEHDTHHASGTIQDHHGAGTLRYEAEWNHDAGFTHARPGTEDEWLLERYTAFTQRGLKRRRFRIWHPAWPQTPARITIPDDTLLRSTGPWYPTARIHGAHYSPGFHNVHMGHARPIA